MKIGPDISRVASLIGDPARTNMLMALVNGEAWTSGDLAREAGVTPATASCHLAKLRDGGLVRQTSQGRHRFYRLADEDVGDALEALLRVAARSGHTRHIATPLEAPLRSARVCYDHLAGEYGVRLLLSLRDAGHVIGHDRQLALSPQGEEFITAFGIPVDSLQAGRRQACRLCMDWSERTYHMGGGLGAALLQRMLGLRWLSSVEGSRAMAFTAEGKAAFAEWTGTS